MANKNTLATLDVSLRDILGVPGRFMGGIVFVCAGDFRQILPVIRGGGMNDELEYCIKSGYFWDDLLKLELTRNVRLKADDAKNKIFAKNLLALGRGESGPIKLPEKFGIVVETRKELVDKVYDNLEENHLNASYFEKRAIIFPTNDDVDRINLMVYDKYMSVDTNGRSNGHLDIGFQCHNEPLSPSSHVETESRKCHHGYEEYMPSQVV
ncbi:uncharacterized protein LOC143025714 [Oratosquilla oratoria]|uniref:uncharacterized protein LOC143025714 n=1 Tax=Oratosquilla oratoria TaxID=337810 RepID=UPI003F767106